MTDHLTRTAEMIHAAADPLSVEQMAWRPAEGKWSSAEILEHLSLAFGNTAKGLVRILELPQPGCRAATLREHLQIMVVTRTGYFPEGRKSPEMVKPRGLPPEQALRAILENLEKMNAAVTAAEKKFGGSIKLLTHPVLGPLNARQWRKFHYIHTRHHMKQIWERRWAMEDAGAKGRG